jgi:branched-chain amino acid transport system permease protein
VVFVVVAAATYLWRPTRARLGQRLEQADPSTQNTLRWIGVLAGILFLFSLPQLAGPLLSQVLVLVGLYVLLGLGLNIVVGYAGLLDLGYVAFYAVGAYLTALLTSPSSSLGGGSRSGSPCRSSCSAPRSRACSSVPRAPAAG